MRSILTLALQPAIALAKPIMFALSCHILVAHMCELVLSYSYSILLKTRSLFFSFVKFANSYSMLQATVEKISREPSMAAELLPIRTMFCSPVWMGHKLAQIEYCFMGCIESGPKERNDLCAH